MDFYEIMLQQKLAGGGGGVNLHTATLTFVGSSDTATIYLGPCLDESTGYLDYINTPLIGSYVVPLINAEGGGGIYSADIWSNGERLPMTSTGGVTITEEQDYETGEYKYYVTITGDCTITLT